MCNRTEKKWGGKRGVWHQGDREGRGGNGELKKIEGGIMRKLRN